MKLNITFYYDETEYDAGDVKYKYFIFFSALILFSGYKSFLAKLAHGHR